ncbi:MAG: PAS domain-containing protein, partial [Methanothrix sp.]|nr:PAS domain-containing protein [Methanothrix sp.]
VGAIQSIRDITKCKHAEQALLESEERFRTLFESSQDALMTLSPPLWRITSGNPAAIEIFLIQANVRDISDQKWAEAALRGSEKRLTRAEEIARFGHWELSLDEKMMRVCKEFPCLNIALASTMMWNLKFADHQMGRSLISIHWLNTIRQKERCSAS